MRVGHLSAISAMLTSLIAPAVAVAEVRPAPAAINFAPVPVQAVQAPSGRISRAKATRGDESAFAGLALLPVLIGVGVAVVVAVVVINNNGSSSPR